jgi:hypothetical protein
VGFCQMSPETVFLVVRGENAPKEDGNNPRICLANKYVMCLIRKAGLYIYKKASL